jgi:hypothetical protein
MEELQISMYHSKLILTIEILKVSLKNRQGKQRRKETKRIKSSLQVDSGNLIKQFKPRLSLYGCHVISFSNSQTLNVLVTFIKLHFHFNTDQKTFECKHIEFDRLRIIVHNFSLRV